VGRCFHYRKGQVSVLERVPPPSPVFRTGNDLGQVRQSAPCAGSCKPKGVTVKFVARYIVAVIFLTSGTFAVIFMPPGNRLLTLAGTSTDTPEKGDIERGKYLVEEVSGVSHTAERSRRASIRRVAARRTGLDSPGRAHCELGR
jgi:hypothetical protein